MSLDAIVRVDVSRRAFLAGLVAGSLAAALGEVHLVLAQTGTTAAPTRSAPGTRMEEGRPSITAQWAANLRAAHQLFDEPKVLNDPLALRIIGKDAASELRTHPLQFQVVPTLRAFVVLRSRYAEDELAKTLERGVRQYVILGAGLDTFAYRITPPDSGFRVFEVDHPATQVWKRARLQEAGIAVPEALVFAPIDFERQTLLEGLASAGFRADRPAFFSMLGVVVYLTEEAVIETFRSIASQSPDSEIVFDYALPSSALTETQRHGREALGKHVAAVGEPWITYLDPASLEGRLRRLGFRQVVDLGADEANARYFKGRNDGLHVTGSSRIMKAGL
jgi:methyltransferase (TIGR00027 family)